MDEPSLPGEGTQIFSYICRLGPLIFGFKIFNLSFFGGVQKNEYFWGYEEVVDIFGGHYIIGLFWGVISKHFRV